jgi:hypothetical protein
MLGNKLSTHLFQRKTNKTYERRGYWVRWIQHERPTHVISGLFVANLVELWDINIAQQEVTEFLSVDTSGLDRNQVAFTRSDGDTAETFIKRRLSHIHGQADLPQNLYLFRSRCKFSRRDDHWAPRFTEMSADKN